MVHIIIFYRNNNGNDGSNGLRMVNKIDKIKLDSINNSNLKNVVFLPHRFGSFLIFIIVFNCSWTAVSLSNHPIINKIIYLVLGLVSLIIAFYHFAKREEQ
jgi:hypothetical protein